MIRTIDYNEAKRRSRNGQYVLLSLNDTYKCEGSYWADENSGWIDNELVGNGSHRVTIVGYDDSNDRFIVSTYGRKGSVEDKDYGEYFGLKGGF